jgi:AcrR family transcriptional regulator
MEAVAVEKSTSGRVEKWTRERRRQLTRTALVEAAGHVFARRGFHGASLDEIAETAGFTRGAIYKHFDGKEDLLFAVYDDVNERVLQAFADQLDQGPQAAFDAHALATTWREVIADNSDLFALELEFRLYELRNPSVRKRSAAQRRRNRQMVAQFMRDHAPATGVTLKMDPDTLAGILLATSDGIVQAAQADPQDANLYEAFLELLIPAVIAEDPTRPSRPPSRKKQRR